MEVLANALKADRYGTVGIEELPRDQSQSDKRAVAIAGKFNCTWLPPDQIACRLDEKLIPRLECWVDKAGMRRFVPAEPAKAFALKASALGHAVLSHLGKADRPGEEFTFHEARLFSQFAQHMREYLGKRLRLGGQLVLPNAARPDGATTHILPADLGLNWDGEGDPWSILRLKEEGLRSAKASGIENPTPDEVLWYGMYEAACRSLVIISEKDAEPLVQRALFAIQREHAKVVPEALAYVKTHVRAFLEEHLKDSTEEFDRRCIQDPKANLFHRISKRKDCPWKRDRVVIRAAMLELAWQSLKMVGRSIDMFARTFAAALPQPLTKPERKHFRRIFQAHRDFGRLPLVLLHDRFDCLRPALMAIWNNPADREAVGALRRLLYWYSEVAENRRGADRSYKERSHGCKAAGGAILELPLCDDRDQEDEEDQDEEES